MSSVINSINESFNRKLKESCEPKKGSKQQIKEGEQLNEIAPIIAAAIPALVQGAAGAIGSGLGQAVTSGVQQGMSEDTEADDLENGAKAKHFRRDRRDRRVRSMRPQRKEVAEDLDDNSRFDLNSDVYNALARIAFKYHKKGIELSEKDFSAACEHFEIYFFNNGGKEDMFGE